jgi:lysine 6-dehydrogenase
MRVVMLGAGLQAQAATFDLVNQRDLTEIVVADADLGRARALAQRWKDPRLHPVQLDASDEAAAEKVLKGARAALSAVPYKFNAGLARAAVRAGCSFCDLGGNNDVVAAELALDEKARAAGVTIVPDCGLAPGLVSILSAHAVEAFDEVDTLELRVGGIPQRKGGVLDYSLVFSMEGLINEYVEDAIVLEGGQPRTVHSLEDFESLDWVEPFGTMEAFNTSGGVSTLPETYRGKIRRLNYKTIRWPGHGRVFQAMKKLGLLSSTPVEVDGHAVKPRALLAKVATPVLDRGEPDVILTRVTALGTRNGKALRRVYEMIEYPDNEHGLTAMMRTTAFPATIVMLMLARGEVKTKGALPQERCVDPRRFLDELAKRQIVVKIQEG